MGRLYGKILENRIEKDLKELEEQWYFAPEDIAFIINLFFNKLTYPLTFFVTVC